MDGWVNRGIKRWIASGKEEIFTHAGESQNTRSLDNPRYQLLRRRSPSDARLGNY